MASILNRVFQAIFAVAAFGVAAAVAEGASMWDLCLFSTVHGTVLDKGRPVTGATVEREFTWDWKSETGRDSTSTGADGSFSFDSIWRSSFLAATVPHEPSIGQRITIRYQGKSYDAWVANKGEYKEDGELRGAKIDLVCELSTPPEERDRHYGICVLRKRPD